MGHLKEYQLGWQFLTFSAILWNCHVQDSSHEENYNSRVTALFLLFLCVWPSLELTNEILWSNCRNAKKSHRKVLWNFLWNLKRQRISLFWFLKILPSITTNSCGFWPDYYFNSFLFDLIFSTSRFQFNMICSIFEIWDILGQALPGPISHKL